MKMEYAYKNAGRTKEICGKEHLSHLICSILEGDDTMMRAETCVRRGLFWSPVQVVPVLSYAVLPRLAVGNETPPDAQQADEKVDLVELNLWESTLT
jgi:hypothetical protein